MATVKHVGRVKNTGSRCVVVFREIYNDKGVVIDPDSCLVFESERLPDAEHQDMMRIVEGSLAQENKDLFNVLARERLGNGFTALEWLHRSNRLHKYPTNNIELVPDSYNKIPLDQLNKIVRMQASGATEEQVMNALRDDTDSAPRQAESVTTSGETEVVTESQQPSAQTSGEDVLTNEDIAASYIVQAETFEKQATELREKAVNLDPTLAPKRVTKKAPTKKAPASKK